MIKRDLKDNFQISISGQDIWYDMSVPGSAMDTFCKEGILPDPYYGMNEYKWTEFWKNDFDIRSIFSVSAEEIASEEILLTFYGIDTVADVFLNGKKLGHTENCLLYTSDAADEQRGVDIGGHRIIKKKKREERGKMSTNKKKQAVDSQKY